MIRDRLRALVQRLSPARQFAREGAARWRALPARDRTAVGIAVLAATLAFLWLVLARPALDTVARWQRDLPKLQAQSAELDQLLAGVPVARAAPGVAEPLQAGLDRAGLRGLYGLQDAVADAPPAAGKASPAKAWRIEFAEPVPAGQVFSWLMAVAARGDVEIVRAALDRVDGAEDPATGSQGLVRGVVDVQSRQLNKDGQ